MGAIPFKPLLVRPRLIIITRPSQLHFIFESGESVWWFWLIWWIWWFLWIWVKGDKLTCESIPLQQKLQKWIRKSWMVSGDVLCQSIHHFDWRWNFQNCSKLYGSTTKNHRIFGVVLISGWNSLLSITLNGLNWSIFRSSSLFFGASFQWEGQLVGGGLPYPGNPGKWFCLQSPYIHPMPCHIIPITYALSASCTKIYDTQFVCERDKKG